jgi:outer membrane receptor protein involved in Fe transport
MTNESPKLVLLASIVLAQPIVALAQEGKLEEIIVTAQKRQERLIDVPMSIQTLSGVDLDQRGISSIQDLSFAVPGLTMREDGPGSYTIFMRGMSNQYGTGALVGVYLDEAPLSLTGYDQMDTRVMDLERVEVLKGPQGTLYGQGSVAGTVRFITRRPNLDEFEGSVDVSYGWLDGGDDKQIYTGVLNVPIASGTFGLRLAGTVERGGGWQDQPAAGIENGNEQELEAFRLRALWTPVEALDVEAMVVVHRNDVQLGLGYENPDRTAPVAIDPARVLIHKVFDYNLYNLDVSYDFGGFELLSASTYIDNDHDYPFSYFGSPETIYGGDLEGTDARYSEADQFSQEIRLASNGDGPLSWTIGGFYRDVDTSLFALYDTLFFGVLYPDAEYFNADSFEQISAFADASYKFFDRLTVGAGVRYFEDDQETDDDQDPNDSAPDDPTPLEKDSFDSVDPRFYATYAVAADVNVYASIGSGFRSGGFNRGDLPNYEPEQAWSYEIGAKGNVADGALSFEIAAYYTDYEDMLRRGLVFVEETQSFESLTGNLGKVEIKGAEGGITWAATQVLTFNATAAYIDSEITEVNATDATSLPGDPVDYVPEWSYTLGANYDFKFGPEMPGYVRVDYAYRDKVSYIDRTSFPPENLPQFSDDLSLLDARIGLDWRSLWFEVFGTNLTNENKWIDPYHAWSNANRTRPRSVGLRIGYSFD